MTASEARELLARCKRQRDVWRIAGLPPSPEAVARVERDEAAAVASIVEDYDAVRDRARRAAQTIIAAIGADGPQNVDEAASRIVARLEAVEAERDLYRAALAEAARGALPGCYECPRPATCHAAEDGREYLACDEHRGEYEWTSTPHAEAIRGALKTTEGGR